MNSGVKGPEVVQRYVDILTDSGFKAVFGDQENKQVLIDFLNAVLPNGRQVKDLTYSTTEIEGFTPENKSVKLDLRCNDVDGSNYIVEMQKYNQKNFLKRCILYSSRMYGFSLPKGDRDYDVPPVYFVGILAVDCFDREDPMWNDHFVSEYTFREKMTGEVINDTIFCTFVELKRFDKELDECENIIDKWCYSLKHMSKIDKLPEVLQAEVFKRLFNAAEIAHFSPDKKSKYVQEMITERDHLNIIETAREEGHKEGRLDGILSVAKAMKENGISSQDIIRMTGLTSEHVEAL